MNPNDFTKEELKIILAGLDFFSCIYLQNIEHPLFLDAKQRLIKGGKEAKSISEKIKNSTGVV